MATPSVGRIVHYVARGSADGVFPRTCRAAIITDVYWSDAADEEDWKGDDQPAKPGDGQAAPYIRSVDLCVLNPSGISFDDQLPYDASVNPAGGSWHWPERVE
jgi:hypothetical protein